MQTFTIGTVTFQYYGGREHTDAQGQLWATCKSCGSHERVARAVQSLAVARMWADDYVHGPYRHTCPSDTTTKDNTMTCADVVARLSEDDLRALAEWRRSVDQDSKLLGGRGRSWKQQAASADAWDALSPDARWAYLSVLYLIADELADAIREVGVPDTERDIDAIEALLGADHPAFLVLPAHSLVVAYRDIVEQIGA